MQRIGGIDRVERTFRERIGADRQRQWAIDVGQSGVFNPRAYAVVMLPLVRRGPVEMGQCRCEGNRVLPSAASDLQHAAHIGQHLTQHGEDGGSVALGRRRKGLFAALGRRLRQVSVGASD